MVDGVEQRKNEPQTQKSKTAFQRVDPSIPPGVPQSPRVGSGLPLTHPTKGAARLLLGVFTGLFISITAASVGTTFALVTPLPGVGSPKEGQKLFGELWRSGFQYTIARPVNILVMGIDRVPGSPEGSEESFSGRSDTLVLLRVDPEQRSVSLLSIPRDTQVEIPNIGLTKINHANANGGPGLVRDVLSNTLNGIEADRYVRVSTVAFRELVDLLGGVDVYVPQKMQYTDKTQKLNIDLEVGLQRLTGDQAEQFARFRNDGNGDIGRVQRQQALIKALRSRLSNPLMLARAPGIVRAMQKYIDTNLSSEELLALVSFGLRLDQKNFKMVLLPGRFSGAREFNASYWILDPAGRDRVLRDYFDVDMTEGEPESPVSTSLRIAIQNASGQPSAGNQFTKYLASQGYDNLYTLPDWDEQQQQTQIIVQKGDLQAAQAIKSVLGVGAVEAASTGDLESDITIRIGEDWAKTQPPLP
jgi:polyisoprenyl-teichoic acid--peptidoglycan teichoic acid transferase